MSFPSKKITNAQAATENAPVTMTDNRVGLLDLTLDPSMYRKG
jgi:hypothetical protein